MSIKNIKTGLNEKGEYVAVSEKIINGKKVKVGIKVPRNKGETDREYLQRIFLDKKIIIEDEKK